MTEHMPTDEISLDSDADPGPAAAPTAEALFGAVEAAVVAVPTTDGSRPASSTAATARSCQVQAPWLVTW